MDRISRSVVKPVPTAESLDKSLKQILGDVKPWSEDLREQKFYINKGWLEYRDDDDFQGTVLHIFKEKASEDEDNEYLRVVDGDVFTGTWSYMAASNKLLISGRNKAEGELFDLAFLDNDFFILQKHGDQERHGHPIYFVMLHEPLGKKLGGDWLEAMKKLHSKADNSVSFYILVTFIILLLIAVFMALR